MASLAELPTELLSRIASYLWYAEPKSYGRYADDGLCSLRLSCRSLQAKTQYAFERAVYSTMAVTLDAKSLSKLRDVSSDSRFGKLIGKLVFFKALHPVYDSVVAASQSEGLHDGRLQRVHEYARYGVIELPKYGVDGVYPNDGLKLRKRVRLGLQDCLRSIMAQTPNLRDIVLEPDFMALFWLDTPSRQEQLNERAAQIQNMQPGSAAADSEEILHLHADNEDYDTDVFDDYSHLETYIYTDHLLYQIVSAAHHSSLPLSSLTSSNLYASSIRARTIVELVPALHSLQNLDLTFSVQHTMTLHRMDGSALHVLGGNDEELPAASLGAALSSLPSLRSLALTFDEDYGGIRQSVHTTESLRGLGERRFEHLSSIRLLRAAFVGHDLYHFLRVQRSGLQLLDLQRITLQTVKHWRPILQLMLEDMPLLKTLIAIRLKGEDSPQRSEFSHVDHGIEGVCYIVSYEREDTLVALRDCQGVI